ncbi:MAG: EamA family transporter [Gammaproteobacteria bacterium]|jgi:drug/metabolite transporter (DMT)-like permease
MNQQRAWLPWAALALLCMIWGYNWVIMKFALHDAGPFEFAALRSVLGALLLFSLLVLFRRPFRPRGVFSVFVLGVLQTSGFVGLVTWALVSGGAGKTAVLAYTMPLWLLLLGWPLLGERVQGWNWLAIILAATGLVFILQPWRFHAHVFSTVLAILAGLAWALSSIWAKRMRGRLPVDLLQLSAWQMLLGSIPLVIAAFTVREPAIHWTPLFVGALAYNAALATALAWLLWLFILRHLPAGQAGMSMLAVPMIGLLSAWLQLGEHPGPWEQAGIVSILLGLALLSFLQVRKAPRRVPEAVRE